MIFSTIVPAIYLNGLWFQLFFSYNRYEKITKLTKVEIRIVEENSLRLITMKTICNMSTFLLFTVSIFQNYYCHFEFKKNISSFFTIIVIKNIYHLNKLRQLRKFKIKMTKLISEIFSIFKIIILILDIFTYYW